jgi:hypothetical protein
MGITLAMIWLPVRMAFYRDPAAAENRCGEPMTWTELTNVKHRQEMGDESG